MKFNQFIVVCGISLLAFVQSSPINAESQEPSFSEAVATFEGMVNYVGVIGNYCVETFPELEDTYQAEKQKWLKRHVTHRSQVDKIQSEIVRKIVALHGEAEGKKYLDFLEYEFNRQNDERLDRYRSENLEVQNARCRGLVTALRLGQLDIAALDSRVSEFILKFQNEKKH